VEHETIRAELRTVKISLIEQKKKGQGAREGGNGSNVSSKGKMIRDFGEKSVGSTGRGLSLATALLRTGDKTQYREKKNSTFPTS